MTDYRGINIQLAPALPPRHTAFMNNVMYMGAVQWAMFNASIDFQGRDRRRIKREVNKAAKAASRKIARRT